MSDVPIKDYVDALFAERAAAVIEAREATATALLAARETQAATERHQNEFRAALSDQAERFVTQSDYSGRQDEMQRRIGVNESAIAGIREELAALRGRAVVITGVAAVGTSAIVGFIVHLLS